MRKDLPVPPTLSEAGCWDIPPPPTDHRSLGSGRRALVRTRGTEAELRWQENPTGEERERRKGRAGGTQIGEARACCSSFAHAVSTFPKALEQRIAECTDPVLLVSWLNRAATVADVSELLAG